MITLEHVTHTYGDHTVLQDLTYTFPDKGIVALMGASGVGKTTLLRLICGLEAPQKGNIVKHYQKLAVSFQEPRLLPWLSAEENVAFVLQDKENAAKTAREMLTLLELDAFTSARPDELSGGMKQRVSLARALAAQADLLLLDEPFSALDDALKSRVIDIVRKANKDGLTIVITHDEKEAEALGATILTLTGTPVTNITT